MLRRSVFEIVIIVMGILIALGIDSLNGYRIDRNTEREYLSRLAEDAQANLDFVQRVQEALSRKQAALASVAGILGSPETLHDHADDMIVALSAGADFGWTFPAFRTYTFDEMRSSGNLDLIVDLELRSSLLGLQETLAETASRINARRTGYPLFVYSLLDPDQAYDYTDTDVPLDLSSLNGALTPAQIDSLVSGQFHALLNAERNYAAFALQLMAPAKTELQSILARLRARSTPLKSG